MLRPARTIWDTKIQCVCGVITASDGDRVEVFLSGNFGQASISPARVVINPNRLYPIEPVIKRTRRFAISVLAASQRDVAIRLVNVRRRALDKARIVGVTVSTDPRFGIPYLPDCLQAVFCEVEQVIDTGDHTLMVCAVVGRIADPLHAGERPLLYQEVSGSPVKHPRLARAARALVTATGAKDLVLNVLARRRRAREPDLPRETYREGGQTDAEVKEILEHGIHDRGRAIFPPGRPPAALRRRVGVCVVGVGAWGSYHCQLLKRASEQVDLYVCGRDGDRVARVGHAVGATDGIIGLERAVEDPRVQALSFVLPHDLHRYAVERAAAAGKHALVEKPIATTLADADAMIATAARAQTILMVAEDMHFRPALREAVLAIERGAIGEPLYALARAGGLMRPEGWKADKTRMGGGVLMDIGVHYVRALRLLMGEPDKVFASRAMQVNTKMSGEDSVQVLLASRYGWQAHMLLSWSSPRGHGPDLAIMGERGTIHLWPGASYIDHYPAAPRGLARALPYVRPSWLAERLAFPRLYRVRQQVRDEDPTGYLAEVREFLAAIVEERSPASGAVDARRDLEIVLRGYEALRLDAWVAVEPQEGSGR